MTTAIPTLRPPLNPAPSTPGPDFPGGYPRTSAVFASNQWDSAETQISKAQPGGGAGLLATVKAHLPPVVASYFPGPSDSDSSAVPTASNSTDTPPRTPTLGTPMPATPHTEGSATTDFSTRAYYAGSARASERDVPTPVPTPGIEGVPNSVADNDSTPTNVHSKGDVDTNPSTLTATATSVPGDSEPNERHTGIVPLPSVAPFASALSSTVRTQHANIKPESPPPASPTSPVSKSTMASASENSVSTPPSSPSSPSARPKFVLSPMPTSADDERDVHADKGGFGKRFASLRTHGRRRDKAPPPSAFTGHARGASLDAAAHTNTGTANGNTAEAASEGGAGELETRPKPGRRRSSFLRTLRGEARRLKDRIRGEGEHL